MSYLGKLFIRIRKSITKKGFMLTIAVYVVKLMHKITWPLANMIFLAFFPLKENRLLFESKGDFSDNARALFDYMIKEGYNNRYEIIWMVADPDKYKQYTTYNVKFVKKVYSLCNCRSFSSLYYASTSKIIFFTHSVPWLLIKKKNQTLINLWHGCGYKASKGNSERINFDYCLVPGKLFIKTKREFFNCSEDQLLPLGYPRYDYLKSKNANSIEFIRKYCNNLKTVIWMPTFRKSSSLNLSENTLGNKDIDLPIINKLDDLGYLDKVCKQKNIFLLIKRHLLQLDYLVDDDQYSNIAFIDDDKLSQLDLQLYELLAHVDALITDYSSVAIDFLLLDKPIGFTLDDFDKYKESRGFVFDDPLAYMPGMHIYNMQELVEFLSCVADNRDSYKSKRLKVRKEVHNETDNYSGRILEFFRLK